jgi:hypothetical protein
LITDSFTDVVLKYAQKQGPTKIKLLWESDSRNLEIISDEYLFNELYSSYTPFIFTTIPDISNQTKSTLVNDDYKIALVGIQETLTIYARDKFGNKQNH